MLQGEYLDGKMVCKMLTLHFTRYIFPKYFTTDGLNDKTVFIAIYFTEKCFSVDVPTISSNKEIVSYWALIIPSCLYLRALFQSTVSTTYRKMHTKHFLNL